MRPTYHFFRNLPIQRKISFGILLTCGTALVVASAAIFLAQVTTFRQTFTRDLEAIGQMLGHNTTAAITFNDHQSAEDLLTAVRAKPYILSAAIDLPNGEQFASYHSRRLAGAPSLPRQDGCYSGGGYLVLNGPILLAGERIATLRLLCDYQSQYRHSLRLYLTILALVLLVSVLLAWVLSERLQRLIAGPVLNLAATAQDIAAKQDYSLRAPKLSEDEVGRLTDAFNEMLSKIEKDDRALREANQSLEHEIAARKRREEEIDKLHKDLVLASRQAGMAEVATGVLHNVGNVLNSINVSVNLVNDHLRQFSTDNLTKICSLLERHRSDLGTFITTDPKGKRVPEFLCQLTQLQREEKDQIAAEMLAMTKNVQHVKEIVAMQQSYAKVAGVLEDLCPSSLVEDALRMNAGAFIRHGITVHRDYQEVPPVRVDKHKVLQILINVLRNAKYAMEAGQQPDKTLTLCVRMQGPERVGISVRDNGIGISRENLTRIFNHGFTTKREGHGFGLHSGALAAKEMGGSLQALSEGPGTGATFVLELPVSRLNGTSHE